MLRRRGAFSVELRDAPWEAAESCVVHTSASVYRRLQESPRGALSPPRAGGQLPRCESEDSGVEMGSTERSPSGSHFPIHAPAAERTPEEEEGAEPPRLPHRKLPQAAQRSRRQRVLGRSPRGAVKPPRARGEPTDAAPEGADPGQGLRYLEHICRVLERLAELQGDTRSTRPDATHHQHPTVRKGERFRPRSCSDSQAAGERCGMQGRGFEPRWTPPAAPDAAPCQRTWGFSVSSPSLLDPSDSAAAAPAPTKDGRSHWGRVKALLTRLTRRSLRGGRCR